MSTLELLQLQNEHKSNTYYEKGEDKYYEDCEDRIKKYNCPVPMITISKDNNN